MLTRGPADDGTWNTGDMGRGGGVSESEEDEEMYRGAWGRAGFKIGDLAFTTSLLTF